MTFSTFLFVLQRSKQEFLKSDLLEGVAGSLCKVYADQPCSTVEDAVAEAVQRAIAGERYPAENVACDVDFGAACPEGAFYVGVLFLQFGGVVRSQDGQMRVMAAHVWCLVVYFSETSCASCFVLALGPAVL